MIAPPAAVSTLTLTPEVAAAIDRALEAATAHAEALEAARSAFHALAAQQPWTPRERWEVWDAAYGERWQRQPRPYCLRMQRSEAVSARRALEAAWQELWSRYHDLSPLERDHMERLRGLFLQLPEDGS